MPPHILGIHHVTAIASDPQQNINFYMDVLGLRLVKRTVNFDDPGTYHLYFGDEIGHPGTILTFFPWPNARRGSRGTGQATVTSFSIPPNALRYWVRRLGERNIAFERPAHRFDEEVITLYDPDGLQIELVAHTEADDYFVWRDGPIPLEVAIRGVYSVTLMEMGCEGTVPLLTEILGFVPVQEHGSRSRYQIGQGPGSIVDVVCFPNSQPGRIAAGTVHHVAWRTPDDDQQLAWRELLAETGLHVTPVMDRQYFHSIYFREPGGVLFEIATDTPGFTLDEKNDLLGSELKLPPWLESQREEIERRLPPLKVPGSRAMSR